MLRRVVLRKAKDLCRRIISPTFLLEPALNLKRVPSGTRDGNRTGQIDEQRVRPRDKNVIGQ